ncbi:uncharacterized protein I206_104481 [Kwoniella pini CBS 10737]|uniref:Uncharacterized protein n=1 Tax=Kwoniella pini CBS 10737 TaxID=1296096 RepID=A0A1B9I6X3_9TREE|nr:uncharacterized protein I206_02011 [Kwoniella pini CBS 10737]OCF51297.1 hypothetical protein I206_02011 [Kwoniella pini CBS 10737]
MAPTPPWQPTAHPHQSGMTYHPGPPHDSSQWVTLYPSRPPSQPYDSTSTMDTSMAIIEEGEEELEEIYTPANRPQRKSKAPSQFDPSCRLASTANAKPKGRGKANTLRSRSSSVLIPTQAMKNESENTAVFLPDPYQSAIQLKGLSKNGLLPAPAGCILDVNDLLILHPPEKENTGLQGHTSQYEMYTCRVCSKTYDGKNARSVARRHLQDKHGVPLSVQKRRSRWDYETDRPKSQEDAKERNLKSKRDWINKHRHMQKLEKNHEAFLERFGPSGIITPCGINLVAPIFRGEVEAKDQKKTRYLDGTQGNLIIPESILEEVEAIREHKSGSRSGSLGMREEETEDTVETKAGKAIIKKTKGRKKSIKLSEPHVATETRSNTPLNSISNGEGKSSQYYAEPLNVSTPVSVSRGIANNPPQVHPWQGIEPFQPASMTVINGQYHFALHPQYQQFAEASSGTYPLGNAQMVQVVQMEDDSVPSSPEEVDALPDQQWVPSEHFSVVRTEHQQLEPALDITQQWQGMQLSSWPVEDVKDNVEQYSKEGSVGAEGEAVAAESLLDLHSTPLRGSDQNGRDEIQITRPQTTLGLVFDQTTMKQLASRQRITWSTELLSAPTVESPTRPRPQRSSSFIQPFRDHRPEVTRSLSFDARPNLDDPFVLSSTPARPSSSSSADKPASISTSIKRSKRHTISLPSPSPLSSASSAIKKRKQAPASPVPPHSASITRSALRPLSTNIKPNYAGSFATPIKPSFGNFPQSVTKEWLQFSSPNNADAVLSLGLAPTHFLPTTPGVKGIVGAETPEMTILEARAKKRRGDDGVTPGRGLRR